MYYRYQHKPKAESRQQRTGADCAGWETNTSWVTTTRKNLRWVPESHCKVSNAQGTRRAWVTPRNTSWLGSRNSEGLSTPHAQLRQSAAQDCPLAPTLVLARGPVGKRVPNSSSNAACVQLPGAGFWLGKTQLHRPQRTGSYQRGWCSELCFLKITQFLLIPSKKLHSSRPRQNVSWKTRTQWCRFGYSKYFLSLPRCLFRKTNSGRRKCCLICYKTIPFLLLILRKC